MEQPIGDGGDLEHELRAWIVRQVTHTSNGVPGEGAMMLMMKKDIDTIYMFANFSIYLVDFYCNAMEVS